MSICWERAVPLAFHLHYFYYNAILIVGVPFPFGVKGRIWNSIVSVPNHCLLAYSIDSDNDLRMQHLPRVYTVCLKYKKCFKHYHYK